MRYKLLSRLLGLALLAGLAQCTTYGHTQRAPRPARHVYHQAERHNERTRARVGHALIFWN